jgi:alanyl-tRNA synthetase
MTRPLPTSPSTLNHGLLHWLAGPLAAETVNGRIDWPRRFDHMQQHTGQHLLSRAFIQVARPKRSAST